MGSLPDVVVSVDLGTTFTGVAWMTPRIPIQVIRDWPGSGDQNERKVPTTLVYNADNTVSTWGFLCDEEDDHAEAHGKRRCEFFKIFIDPETLADVQQKGLPNAPTSPIQAQQMVTDYLRHVYTHVKSSVEGSLGRRDAVGWRDMAVEFLFSVPTTWTNQSIVNCFKTAIRNAGFGIEGPRHSAEVDLTEAEAAAVATIKNSAVDFGMGSVFLTVDAGGGTTDLALMRVTSADQVVPQMSSMNAVNGVGVGAILIDRLFMYLVVQRLAPYPEITAHLPADFASRLGRSHHFRNDKHKFGNGAYLKNEYRIPMEGVSHDYSHSGAGIKNGKMTFSLHEFQSLFDPQIDSIIRRVTEQLDWLQAQCNSQQVQHMILSGGLGSSVYVRSRLQHHFKSLPHPNAPNVVVIPCTEPQLVVVRGLLLDRQQRWETGGSRSVLASRIARASYGVIVQEMYSPQIHIGEDIRADAHDSSQVWAVNQIQWLIRKGEVVDPNRPLVKSFEIRLASGDVTRSWASEIVISQNDPMFLPSSLKKPGAMKLCEVKSDLTGIQQHQLVEKHKRGSCFSRGHKFYICQFDVRVIVAPADLRFELWFGGEKFSADHEPISVTWEKQGTMLKA